MNVQSIFCHCIMLTIKICIKSQVLCWWYIYVGMNTIRCIILLLDTWCSVLKTFLICWFFAHSKMFSHSLIYTRRTKDEAKINRREIFYHKFLIFFFGNNKNFLENDTLSLFPIICFYYIFWNWKICIFWTLLIFIKYGNVLSNFWMIFFPVFSEDLLWHAKIYRAHIFLIFKLELLKLLIVYMRIVLIKIHKVSST